MRTVLHSLLREHAEARPDAPALSYKGSTQSYAEVWASACAIAAGLGDLGLARGDRCAIFLEKRPATVASIFAATAAGGVFVPVNPLLKAGQVAHILEDCSVKVLITSKERLVLLREELKRCEALEHIVLVGTGAGTVVPDEIALDVAVHAWDEVFPAGASAPADATIDQDLAAILYTSGSTGKPKGVVLSHRNLVAGAESVSSYLGNGPEDVILSVLPLSFDAGLSQITTAFAVGAHVVLMNYLLPGEVPALCAEYGVTGLTCVPPLWLQLAGVEWPPEARERLRYFANTGGRMPRATLQRLREHFPAAQPFLMYGLTESFRSTYLDPAEVDRRPDSIGKAIPNAEVLVVRQDGTPCEPGEEGELVHRGALVAQGYWGDSARTAERFRPLPREQASWRTPELCVWSGDRVVADEEGFLYFVGRLDDMIKTSGYRVSPTEIEEVAYDTGLVRDAVALGLPDDRLGQRIVLLVTPPAGRTEIEADRLLTALRRAMPPYMVPSTIDVRPELPRSPNGKFDRVLILSVLTS
ncbi:acyl-CoA ligase (AMP-forming), exosortase A-associated [Nocardioides sp. YR527]|uniref:acyl-CoA ligase (AMP-forming), exosortase A system-associated n=1 Tax=Nocardioides sp. YR527 TaxID=1881028 RepID=UPI000885FA6B|nr:acyl-CoA ligase (AMP-forming), exosortase A system-associated [Nocardioides sp. YR527]SDK96596.1 acyl-CoA ligase (AMP-forming), exosortase A-associated [Nocardioides sp. YR527]